MTHPKPTPIYRFFHLDNLSLYLSREAFHAPIKTPTDGLTYRTIHEEDIQNKRAITPVRCSPNGVIHDYVPFYFGNRSPMLLTISHKVPQEEIIYICCHAQDIVEKGCKIAFSDGHGIMKLTQWYNSLNDLSKLDWDAINARFWKDTDEFPDRMRRKQAEFLVHEECSWDFVKCIGVLNSAAQGRVQSILNGSAPRLRKEILIKPQWYY